MDQHERDIEQLHTILRYCERLEVAKAHFEDSFDRFQDTEPFQDSCSLCLIQIGEAVNRLSEAFCESHPEIPWSKIYGMRCHLVHGYEMFDAEIAWDAIQSHIPPLRAFCEERVCE
ncbi:HepT-like ribonuclease domain-containing protein [Adlercreutzia sp. ZJ141]|uniref:HepT-like ribonuclease domain-containing protein n=1 Tax=Adlercreutzia sp. ZJ141 TaxID=2709406 RepID=UPI0013EC4FA6|nr:HepT-like ribonuclease domain-containing protein [Adlercreutzia sp. ZJ141]